MRGPYERLKYDLRRIWECPVCKRRERTAGTVTYRHCQCQMKQVDGRPVVMKLVEDGVQRLGRPVVIHHEAESELSAAQPPISDSPTAANHSEPSANPDGPS